MTPSLDQDQITRLRILHGEAVANKGGDFEIDCDESFRLAFMAAAPQLLDAAAQLAQLRAILDRVRPLEAAATPAPWNVVWTGQHDYDLAIAARNAMAEMLRVTGGQP